jgi:lipid-binding SYLF domain-containing protein
LVKSAKKSALIVGGEYGQGAMRIAGKTVDYYSMISGSIGFQIGGQAKDVKGLIADMSIRGAKFNKLDK